MLNNKFNSSNETNCHSLYEYKINLSNTIAITTQLRSEYERRELLVKCPITFWKSIFSSPCLLPRHL